MNVERHRQCRLDICMKKGLQRNDTEICREVQSGHKDIETAVQVDKDMYENVQIHRLNVQLTEIDTS